jgi:hypothetical protein
LKTDSSGKRFFIIIFAAGGMAQPPQRISLGSKPQAAPLSGQEQKL